MTSTLIITSVEALQPKIISAVKDNSSMLGVYISLNKTQKSTENILKESGINVQKIFFIDCVTTEKTRDDVMHIMPVELDMLLDAIREFIKDIPGEKYLVIDALSTLLIYNNENKVAQFVKDITSYSADNNVHVMAFSPETRGEELLEKIYNFFDEVDK